MKKTIKKFLPKIIGAQLNSLHLVHSAKATKKAFKLFCTPRLGKAKPHHNTFLNPAKTQEIMVEGTSIQCYRWPGEGKKVLLIHGWESNTHRWKKLIEELQEQSFDVYALDAPAHGNSKGKIIHVPLYAQVIHQSLQKINPAYVIGHSMGAMASVYEQYTYKSPIEKLVLLGPPSELQKIISDYQAILKLRPALIQDLENYFFKNLGYKYNDFSIAKFAKSLQVPGLIIHDKYDKIAPVYASRSIHNAWQNSFLIETEGLGHSLYSPEVNTEIIKFLNAN
jgi:pimeloyl-ACP methyl ester carboxylesterase